MCADKRLILREAVPSFTMPLLTPWAWTKPYNSRIAGSPTIEVDPYLLHWTMIRPPIIGRSSNAQMSIPPSAVIWVCRAVNPKVRSNLVMADSNSPGVIRKKSSMLVASSIEIPVSALGSALCGESLRIEAIIAIVPIQIGNTDRSASQSYLAILAAGDVDST